MVDCFTTPCGISSREIGQYDDIDDQSIHDGSHGNFGNFDLPNKHQSFIYRKYTTYMDPMGYD